MWSEGFKAASTVCIASTFTLVFSPYLKVKNFYYSKVGMDLFNRIHACNALKVNVLEWRNSFILLSVIEDICGYYYYFFTFSITYVTHQDLSGISHPSFGISKVSVWIEASTSHWSKHLFEILWPHWRKSWRQTNFGNWWKISSESFPSRYNSLTRLRHNELY